MQTDKSGLQIHCANMSGILSTYSQSTHLHIISRTCKGSTFLTASWENASKIIKIKMQYKCPKSLETVQVMAITWK